MLWYIRPLWGSHLLLHRQFSGALHPSASRAPITERADMGRRMLITLQLGLLLLALLISQRFQSVAAPTAPATAAAPAPARTAAPAAGSVRALRSTVSILVVPLSSLLLHLYF